MDESKNESAICFVYESKNERAEKPIDDRDNETYFEGLSYKWEE